VSRLTRIDKDDNVSTFLEDTHGSMSLGFDAKGRLIAGELVPEHSKVGVIYPKGSETVLAENFGGRPNDLVVDRRGGVYFTVPNPDIQPGAPRPPEFAPAVYYIPPGGKEKKIAEGITFPNGIQQRRRRHGRRQRWPCLLCCRDWSASLQSEGRISR